MKKVKLTDIAPYSGVRVQPFDGVKKYMSTGDMQNDGLSFVEVTFADKPSRADILVSEGDVLFAKMVNTDKALQIDKSLNGIIVSTGFSVHKPIEKKLNSDFFLHFLKHKSFHRQKNKFCTGAIQSAISNSGIEKIYVPLPEYSDQNEIAKTLNKAEDLVNQRRQSIDLLDEFLKSSFLEMFGDPNLNQKGWEKYSLESLCERIVDCPHETPVYPLGKTGFYCVRSSDIQNGEIDFNQTREVSEETYLDRIKRHEPQSGEVIYTREGGRLGNAARIPIGKKVCLGQRMMLFIANKKLSNNEFIWALLNSTSIKKRVENISGGGAAPRINISELRKLQVFLPSYKLQNDFASIVNNTETLKEQYKVSLQELENFYGSLTQQAFQS